MSGSETPHRVAALLEDYVRRGFLYAASGGERRGGRTTFRILWHHRRQFRLVCDEVRDVVSFPALLPGVPARSPMARELKTFLRSFETEAVPSHRRIDPAKARLRIAVRSGTVSVALHVLDGDLEYGARRLVHLAHEVFMVFLPDGPYDAYRVDHLGLDPEVAWA